MRAPYPLAIPVVLLAAACESVSDPGVPDVGSPRPSAEAARLTSVLANVDGSFGSAFLTSCNEGYDLIYQYTGTVTIIETTDKSSNITNLQFVWNLTLALFNSATGYSLSGPSYGPDHWTFNSDGTSRLVQTGLLLHLKTPDGTQLIDAGSVEFLIDENGGVTLVGMHGPHPDHEGFPERPVLCALLNH